MIHPKQVPGAPVGGVAHFSSIAPTTANNFAGSALQIGSTLGGIVLGTNTITFPSGIAGNYFVGLSVAGSTSASAVLLSAATLGAGVINLFTQTGVRDAASSAVSLAGTTTSSAMTSNTVSMGTAGGLLTYAPSTLVGGNAMDLWIFSLPATVLTLTSEDQKLEDEMLILRKEFAEFKAMFRNKFIDSASGGSTPLRVKRPKHESSDEEPEIDVMSSMISSAAASKSEASIKRSPGFFSK